MNSIWNNISTYLILFLRNTCFSEYCNPNTWTEITMFATLSRYGETVLFCDAGVKKQISFTFQGAIFLSTQLKQPATWEGICPPPSIHGWLNSRIILLVFTRFLNIEPNSIFFFSIFEFGQPRMCGSLWMPVGCWCLCRVHRQHNLHINLFWVFPETTRFSFMH